LVAIPGPTKTEAAFRQDDIACRVALVPLASAAGDSSQPAPPPDVPPAVAYLRCMENRGNIIQPVLAARGPVRPAYPVGDYGGDYYPWVYNDSVSFGSGPGGSGFRR
jgi:hypothetical protein